MLDNTTVTVLQRHWEDGWTEYDLDTIMAPMAQNVIFSSPFVATMTGDPAKTTIEGYDALRSYIADALRRTAGIAYTLDKTYVGTDSVILAHTVRLPDGTERKGSDFMLVDATNKVVEYRSHFPFVPEEVQKFITD